MANLARRRRAAGCDVSAALGGADGLLPMTVLPQLDLAAQSASQWVDDLDRRLGWLDRDKVYLALVATLHALRDSLPPQEAVFLAQCLTPLVRGLYYEGWHMAGKPMKERSVQEFADHVLEELPPKFPVDPLTVTRGVKARVRAVIPKHRGADRIAAEPETGNIFLPGVSDSILGNWDVGHPDFFALIDGRGSAKRQ